MMAKADKFVPSDRDMKWMESTLGLISNGGVWATSYAFYRKRGNKLICERDVQEVYGSSSPMSMNRLDIESNINRDKITALAVGYEFVDVRKTINN